MFKKKIMVLPWYYMIYKATKLDSKILWQSPYFPNLRLSFFSVLTKSFTRQKSNIEGIKQALVQFFVSIDKTLQIYANSNNQ